MRSLNETEEKSLQDFKERLSREWASSMSEDVEKIRHELNNHIHVSKSKVDVDEKL